MPSAPAAPWPLPAGLALLPPAGLAPLPAAAGGGAALQVRQWLPRPSLVE
jgi:hypothetical protein